MLQRSVNALRRMQIPGQARLQPHWIEMDRSCTPTPAKSGFCRLSAGAKAHPPHVAGPLNNFGLYIVPCKSHEMVILPLRNPSPLRVNSPGRKAVMPALRPARHAAAETRQGRSRLPRHLPPFALTRP
jgi:hypothetical protein